MGSAESDHLNSMLSSAEAYQQYYGFIHNLVDQQDIHAIEIAIDKIQHVLKDAASPPHSKMLAVQLARELITTGSYSYFVLLSTRVLPLLVYSAEFKKQQRQLPSSQQLMSGTHSFLPSPTQSDEFIRMVLETIMAVAIWLPINPYQSQNFPSLFRLEYERLVYDDMHFPERFIIVKDYEPEKYEKWYGRCKQSYLIKIPRRLDFVQQFATYLKKRFKEYLSRGTPLQYRRLAMNVLWTGDNYFCAYIVELCCKAISDPTATQFKRMNALDFLEDVFGVADVQCLEEIKAKALPCMLQYIFPIDFKQNKYLPSPKFLNSNLRNRCIWLLAVWTKRMRQFPIINRSLYEVVYDRISGFQYTTDPVKLERQEEVTSIMEQNIKYRRTINDAKMNSYIIPAEIDVCVNLMKNLDQARKNPYFKGFSPENTVHRGSFIPTHQVISLKPQSLPSVAADNYVPFTMTSSRVFMQHPGSDQRTSRAIPLSSDKSSKVVLPRPSELRLAEAQAPIMTHSSSLMMQRSHSSAPRVVSNMINFPSNNAAYPIARPQSPLPIPPRIDHPAGSQPSIIDALGISTAEVKHPVLVQPPILHSLNQIQPHHASSQQVVSAFIPMPPPQVPEANPFVVLSVPPPQPPSAVTSSIQNILRPLSEPPSTPQIITTTQSFQHSGQFPVPIAAQSLPSIQQSVSLPQSPPAYLVQSFSPKNNQGLNSVGSDVNNSINKRPGDEGQTMMIHRTIGSVPLISSQQHMLPTQETPVVKNVIAPAMPAVVIHRPQLFVSASSGLPNGNIMSLSLESKGIDRGNVNINPSQQQQRIQMMETIKGISEPSVIPRKEEVVFDMEVNEELSGQLSHFVALESVASAQQLFNDTYDHQFKPLLSVSIVKGNESRVENEFSNDDISAVYQSVQKAAFAFDALKLREPAIVRVSQPIVMRKQSVTSEHRVRSSGKDKIRPCTPLSVHMNRIKEALSGSSETVQSANLYGLKGPNSSSANNLPSAVRVSYENKIRMLEEELKLRMQKEDEYQEELGKLASTIRQNNMREERIIAGQEVNSEYVTDKTKLKGYSQHRRVPSEEEHYRDSRLVVAAISKPMTGWSQIGGKKLLIRSKDMLLARSNLEVGYIWRTTLQRVSLQLYYKFLGRPVSQVATEFESPDVVVQLRPIIQNMNLRADQQIKQEVNLKLVRIENFCRPILHLLYRQGKQTCRESVELPLTLFRFVRHRPASSEEFSRAYQDQNSIRYFRTIHSLDKQFNSSLEGLRELIPELERIKTGNISQQSSQLQTAYGCVATLNQQEVMLRLIIHPNRSVTIEIQPRKGSAKLASVYLEALSNLLRED